MYAAYLQRSRGRVHPGPITISNIRKNIKTKLVVFGYKKFSGRKVVNWKLFLIMEINQ